MVRCSIYSLSALVISTTNANFLDFDFEEFLKEYDFKFTSTTAEPTTEEIDFNANQRSYGAFDFEQLKQQVRGPGFRDAEEPCRDLEADTLRNLENTGYLDCMFPQINNSSDFVRATHDCSGQLLDGSQEWYIPVTPFQGKPNSMYYASTSEGKPVDNHAFCTDTDVNGGNMPLGSMSWCPYNQTEAAWLWHHHPSQPWQKETSNSISTLYTGIWAEDNSGNVNKKWFCGFGIEDESHEDYRGQGDHTFFNWADGEPNFGKHKAVHFQMLVPDMVDSRPSKTGFFYCELNCDLLRICEALNCEKNDATCVDTGTLATSSCICNDNTLTWNAVTKTCSDVTTTETTSTSTSTEEPTTTTEEPTTTTLEATVEEQTTTNATTTEVFTTVVVTTTNATTTEEPTTTTEEPTTTTEEPTTTTEEPTTTTTEEPTTSTEEPTTSTEEPSSTVYEYQYTSTNATTTTDATSTEEVTTTTTTEEYTTTTVKTTTTTAEPSTTTTEEPTTTTTEETSTSEPFTTTTNATTTTEEFTTSSTDPTSTSTEMPTTSGSTTESTTSEPVVTTTTEEETTTTTVLDTSTSEEITSTSTEEPTSTSTVVDSTTSATEAETSSQTTTDVTSTTSTTTEEETTTPTTVSSPSPIVNVQIPLKFQGMKKMLLYILHSLLNPNGQKNWTVHFRARRDNSNNSTFLSQSDIDELLEHGCHCHKLDQEKGTVSTIGSGAVIDEMDSICRDWLSARRCVTYAGGSCFAVGETESYQLQINTETNELDCSLNDGDTQCVQDVCYIDAQFAGFILGEIQNNYVDTGFVAIQGDSSSCPNSVGLLAPIGCTGTAPNVEIIRELP